MPGIRKMKRPVRLHCRDWYSGQASGSQRPSLAARRTCLRPPKMRIARLPLRSTGTGSKVMQWRSRPSGEYSDQNLSSFAP